MFEKEFYDRVYLCSQQIGKVDCKRFNSFEDAELYHRTDMTVGYKNKKTNESQLLFPVCEHVSTVIPMCKYTPEIFDKLILKFKLTNCLRIHLS